MKNALGTNRSDTIRKMREVKRKERGESERERERKVQGKATWWCK